MWLGVLARLQKALRRTTSAEHSYCEQKLLWGASRALIWEQYVLWPKTGDFSHLPVPLPPLQAANQNKSYCHVTTLGSNRWKHWTKNYKQHVGHKSIPKEKYLWQRLSTLTKPAWRGQGNGTTTGQSQGQNISLVYFKVYCKSLWKHSDIF